MEGDFGVDAVLGDQHRDWRQQLGPLRSRQRVRHKLRVLRGTTDKHSAVCMRATRFTCMLPMGKAILSAWIPQSSTRIPKL